MLRMGSVNMRDVRIIKKYPNRRLYDTAISSYITLADVKNLVLDGVEFEVFDAKTKADLTRSILLQIIAEEEEGGEPIFSAELLAQVIRCYGGSEQNMLTSYLEKSMQLWADQQRLLQEQARSPMEGTPMSMLAPLAERNLALWQAMTGMTSDFDKQRRRSDRSQTPTAKIRSRAR
jgi:polyhydroxyalkanoate synthesis repressor PhaR